MARVARHERFYRDTHVSAQRIVRGGLVVAVTIASAVGSLAVAAREAAAQHTWRAERTRRGDTTLVRTVAGSVWRDTLRLVPELAIGSEAGEPPTIFGSIAAIDVAPDGRIFVLDRQSHNVRVFGQSGAHIRTIGRRGNGPGEFENPGAMRVTRDGRIIVRHGARISVLSVDGAYLNGWTLNTGFGTGEPFQLTNDGRVLNPTFMARLVWYRLDGTALDTIPVPQRGSPTPMLDVPQPGGGMARYSIDYLPSSHWALTADGRIMVGRSDEYAFDVPKPDGTVLRISRAVEPVRIPSAEAQRIRDETTEAIRRMRNPGWQWNGPPIPEHKPAFSALEQGSDGTIWVARHTPSREIANPDWDAQRPTAAPRTIWTEASVTDVFDADGRYLGAVHMPVPFAQRPRAVVSVDRVWMVVSHADGYQQVVRYRVDGATR